MLRHVSSILLLPMAANWLRGQEIAALNSPTELKKLSIEDLMNLPVTTVSREPEPWFSSPSAIQILTWPGHSPFRRLEHPRGITPRPEPPGRPGQFQSRGHFGKVEEIKTCHILYICQSEAARLDHILAVLKGKPVLTVSNIEKAAIRGLMIRFITEHNRIRLRVNLESVKAAGLRLSSKLLRAAEIVGPDNK